MQILTQKIFEILEFTGMTDNEFFDRCLREPIDVVVGIKHPETDEICLGFCNHKDAGLMFYLPEDLDFNGDQSNQKIQKPSLSQAKRQILLKEFPSNHHPDNDE